MFGSFFLINLAGAPAQISPAGTSQFTTELASTTAPSPMVTPPYTMALALMHTLSPSVGTPGYL